MKQYTIFEPIKTTRVTTVNAPDNLTPVEVYTRYADGESDIEIVDSYTTPEDEIVYGHYNIEENK